MKLMTSTLFLCASLSVGCGTMINMYGYDRDGERVVGGETKIYGGVAIDKQLLLEQYIERPEIMPIVFTTMAVDIPLSFAADTVLLPICVAEAIQKSTR